MEHKFKSIILWGDQGRECEKCGYKERVVFFGKIPLCPVDDHISEKAKEEVNEVSGKGMYTGR